MSSSNEDLREAALLQIEEDLAQARLLAGTEPGDRLVGGGRRLDLGKGSVVALRRGAGKVVQGEDHSLPDATLLEGQIPRQQVAVAAQDPLTLLRRVAASAAANVEQLGYQPGDRDVAGQGHLSPPGLALDGDEESL